MHIGYDTVLGDAPCTSACDICTQPDGIPLHMMFDAHNHTSSMLPALQGGPAAKNPQYLHCVEHALGLGDWAKQHGATLVATDDKDRSNSGGCPDQSSGPTVHGLCDPA
jgi:hypothetical protein